MWVKRTEPEIETERKRQRRSRVLSAMVVGFIFLVVVLFTFGWREAGERRGFFVPANELLPRLPFAVGAGLLLGFFYRWQERKRLPMMICPHCEATKYADGTIECSCGGHFEMMEEMKYVA